MKLFYREPETRDLSDSREKTRGQALVEYALILATVVMALVAILAVTGPAIGNVFSNTVHNILDAPVARETLSSDEFWLTVTAVWLNTPEGHTVDDVYDSDGDGYYNHMDNCPSDYNPGQEDSDGDGLGDACDDFDGVDTDGDGWGDDEDNCPNVENPLQTDTDNNGIGDACESNDWDNDGHDNDADNCPEDPNPDQLNTDVIVAPPGDDDGDACDDDDDDDGYNDDVDNCPVDPNPGQDDVDSDGIGDECDPVNDLLPTPVPTEATFDVPWSDDVEQDESPDFFIHEIYVDDPNCGWAITEEYSHSSSHAWSDSPTTAYVHGSNCILELRGEFDLGSLASPQLTFWDRWHLSAYDKAYVEISVNDGASWINVATEDNGALHYNSTNLTFDYEVIDLSSYAGQTIRLRFRLDATDNVSTGDGWYIDDIAVDEANPNAFTYPFFDDADGGGSCSGGTDCWLQSGTWARSAEEAHTGTFAWTDSPGANYVHGTNTSLTLNGYIEIPSDAVDPTLTFWNRRHLRAYDHAIVEIATDASPSSWTELLNFDYNDTNLAWSREVFDLSSYAGQNIRIRFRLDALDHTAVGNGWWVDNISVDTVTLPVINSLPWWDDMEGSSVWWLPEGDWALSTEQAHSGSSAWSDSPGAEYIHNTSAVLNLNASINLTGTTAPELVFWDRYNLRAYDFAVVEVSTDAGQSWAELYDHYYESNLTWSQHTVDLSSYTGYSDVRIRFRLDARAHTQVADGWWIDDVTLREQEADPVITLNGGRWCEDFEGGTTQWCDDPRYTVDYWVPNGTWSLGTDAPPAAGACHSGSACWSDSPGGPYTHGSNSALELDALIDLTGTTNPVLFYWEGFNLRSGDEGRVEVSTDGGLNWQQADSSHSTDVVGPSDTNYYWRYNRVSLAAYTDQQIKIRFRLDAVDNGEVGDGWWIDDITIKEYDPYVYTLAFLDDAEPGYWENWIAEGTWSVQSDLVCDPSNHETGDDQLECPPTDYAYASSHGVSNPQYVSYSLILDGVVDLSGTEYPILMWHGIYNLRSSSGSGTDDVWTVEVSTDGGYSWDACWTRNNDVNRTVWRLESCSLRSWRDNQVHLRLRIDTRNGDSDTLVGVYVDRLQIVE
jgi:hypothetical protein